MRMRSVLILILALLLSVGLILSRGWRAGARSGSHPAQDRLLQQAVERGDAVGVRRALQAGADPNATRKSAQPSLAGRLLGARRASAMPLLVVAAEAGADQVVRALMEGGADPNARGPGDRTALMRALLAGHTTTAQVLLDHGANISAADEAGRTALILCLQSDQGIPAAKLLLAHGADVTHRAKDGDSALREALIGNRRDIAIVLLKRGADANLRGVDAAGSFTINGITWPNAGGTALMWASRNSLLDLMKALLDHGADVNARDAQGRTALMWAAYLNHADAVRLLLRRGADAGLKDGRGQTALSVARAVHATDVEALLQNIDRQPAEHGGVL